jgi:hypothetical protein
VFNTLTEAVKKRMLHELRRFWSYDPNYKDTLVPNIQGKYSFAERPCQAIILKGASANQIKLSADNFQGTVVSYCHLVGVENNPGLSIEWVRENARAIIDNGGVMPSPPGIYYVEVRKESIDLGAGPEERFVFYVDPLLQVIDETPMQISPSSWQLQNGKFHPGSLRLFEMPGPVELFEGINYTADPDTGEITLVRPVSGNRWISADYRYPGTSTGPYLLLENHTNVEAIPGVVLAFGRRVTEGDIMAVYITELREPNALEYGGRWELNLDLDIMALDVYEQGEITDRTMFYLACVLRNRLSTEGIEILEVSMGGESEEIYDETADDYFYNASISVQLQTDWSLHVPLTAAIRQVVPLTAQQREENAAKTDEELAQDGENTKLVAVENLGLRGLQDPFFVGRNKTYEVIR